jgi:hypothetical protein
LWRGGAAPQKIGILIKIKPQIPKCAKLTSVNISDTAHFCSNFKRFQADFGVDPSGIGYIESIKVNSSRSINPFVVMRISFQLDIT